MAQDAKQLTAKQSSKAVLRTIANIKKSGIALEVLIQSGLRQVIRHAAVFHDTDKAKLLVTTITESIPGYAVNQLVAYIERYSPIKFEYDAKKQNVIGVSESKDKLGNLTKAYAPDDVLEAAPFILEKAVKTQNQKQIEPASLKWYKDRLASLEAQLTKAGKSDGRGILGMRDGSPVTLHIGDEGYDAAYNMLKNAIHSHASKFDSIVTMVVAGTPAAATNEKQMLRPRRRNTQVPTEGTANEAGATAIAA